MVCFSGCGFNVEGTHFFGGWNKDWASQEAKQKVSYGFLYGRVFLKGSHQSVWVSCWLPFRGMICVAWRNIHKPKGPSSRWIRVHILVACVVYAATRGEGLKHRLPSWIDGTGRWLKPPGQPRAIYFQPKRPNRRPMPSKGESLQLPQLFFFSIVFFLPQPLGQAWSLRSFGQKWNRTQSAKTTGMTYPSWPKLMLELLLFSLNWQRFSWCWTQSFSRIPVFPRRAPGGSRPPAAKRWAAAASTAPQAEDQKESEGENGSIHLYTHASKYVCMYVCRYVRTYVHTYVCMYVYIYIYNYMCICIYRLHMYMDVHMNIYLCTCVSIYIYIYRYICHVWACLFWRDLSKWSLSIWFAFKLTRRIEGLPQTDTYTRIVTCVCVCKNIYYIRTIPGCRVRKVPETQQCNAECTAFFVQRVRDFNVRKWLKFTQHRWRIHGTSMGEVPGGGVFVGFLGWFRVQRGGRQCSPFGHVAMSKDLQKAPSKVQRSTTPPPTFKFQADLGVLVGWSWNQKTSTELDCADYCHSGNGPPWVSCYLQIGQLVIRLPSFIRGNACVSHNQTPVLKWWTHTYVKN